MSNDLQPGFERRTLISALLDAAVDAVIVIDQQGVIRECSHSTSALFGYLHEEMLGENVSILMPEPDSSSHDDYISNYLSSGRAQIIGVGRDVRGKKKTGETFPMHLSVGESVLDGERLFVGICHDLTSYHDALHQLAIAEQRYSEILHSQKQFICRLDSNLRITFANASLIQALGLNDEALLGRPIMIFTEEQGEAAREILSALFSGENQAEEISVKISMRSNSGGRALVDWTFRRAAETSIGGVELQGFGIDISDQEKALRQARYFRRHDPLTGFLNKRSFVEACQHWVADKPRVGFFHMDCARFGLINQRYGYEVGDAVLIEAAARIKHHIDRPNVCARIGADDFLIAVELGESEDPLSFAEGLLAHVTRPFLIDNHRLQLEGRIGVAIFPEHSTVVENLPELAESAVLIAGKRGGSGVAFFDPEHQRAMQRRLDIEQRLKDALQNDDIEIFLQPKYTVEDSRLSGFEALVRWTDSELGRVFPDEFVAVAEQSSLGFELDKYVIDGILSIVQENAANNRKVLPIAVNITANHFADTGFGVFLLNELAKRDLHPSAIELEITEGVIMERSRTAYENLALLRENGIRIAIDDFGTGYSSLSYLRNLEVDELKIDRSFIEEVLTAHGSALVQSVIQIAKAFGITVVAEGVETEAQLNALRSMGCDYCQGYLLARPMPAAQALSLL